MIERKILLNLDNKKNVLTFTKQHISLSIILLSPYYRLLTTTQQPYFYNWSFKFIFDP